MHRIAPVSPICAVLMLLAGALPASAQEMIDGGTPTDVVRIARGYGSAVLESLDNGTPKITGRIDGLGYAVYFLDCEPQGGCGDLNFYTAFSGVQPDAEAINRWNAGKRFGRAYLDSDGDAAVEMDVVLEFGISRANLDANFAVWRLVMNQYARHVGVR